jgi:O-antigen ligase
MTAAVVASAGVLACAAGVLWFHLSFRTQLRVLGVVTPLQLFVPGTPLPSIAVVLLFVTALHRVVLRPHTSAGDRFRRCLDPAVLLAAAPIPIAFTTLVARPELASVLVAAQYAAMLTAAIMLGRAAVRSGVVRVPDLVLPWLLGAAVDAVLTIVFRFAPDTEIRFLEHPVAALFINGSVVRGLFTDAPNNVLDPDKAGAFFVNGNVGSAFLGVACCLAVMLVARGVLRPWCSMLAVLFACAVIATGSKTGAVLLCLLAVWVLVVVVRSRTTTGWWVLALLPFVALAMGPLVVDGLLSPIDSAAASTSASSRLTLWSLAFELIAASPVFGSGYGAWLEHARSSFGLIGSAGGYPPHNLVLATWMNQGVLGVVVVVAFTVVALRRTWRLDRSGMASAAVAWTAVHAMGDNTSLLGEVHIMPVLALLVGAARVRDGVVLQPVAHGRMTHG